MTIYRIKGDTPKTKDYSPAVFVVGYNAFSETYHIFCESPVFGFMVREDMSIDQFREHLENMQAGGFSVTEEKIKY